MNWDELGELIREVDAKDASTGAHTARVALYAQAMAEAGGADLATVKRVMQAALMHDIGKVDVPGEILGKPGRLTEEEFVVMRRHTVRGHERLLALGVDDELALELVRWHHERPDGTGYPDRLAAGRIPRAALDFAVIDTFDALTSRRPYRQDVGPDAAERAIAELIVRSGTWYDADSVRRFVELYRTGQLEWILMHLNDEDAVIVPTPDEVAAIAGRRRT